MRQGLMRAGLVVSAFAATLAVAAPAGALSTRTATDTTTNAHGQYTATAKCRNGEHVVSGGYLDDGSGASAVVSRAKRGDRWTVRDFADGDELKVYAYCSRSLAPQASQASTPVSGSVTVKSTAACDPGLSAIAGGYSFGNDTDESNSPVFSSLLTSPRRWTVSGVFETTPSRLTTYAYCARGIDVKVRSARSNLISADDPSGGVGSATARCHRGEELLSGGYETIPTPDWNNATGPDVFYNQSSRSGKRAWTAAGITYSSVPGRIVAYADCAT